MRIIIYRDACIGCGVVAAVCPEVFVLGDDNGKCCLRDEYIVRIDDGLAYGEIPDNMYGCVLDAVKSCPVDAIKIVG